MNTIALPLSKPNIIDRVITFMVLMLSVIAIAASNILPKQRPAAFEFALDLFTGIVFAVTHPTTVRNTLADTVVDLLDAGAGAGLLIFQTSGDVEVATLTFSDPAFGNASSGTATANSITDDTSATGGTTDRFDAEDSNNTDVFYGSVGTSGQDINLSSVAIGANDTVSVTSLTYSAPA